MLRCLLLEYYDINQILRSLQHTSETWESHCQWICDHPEHLEWIGEGVTPRWEAMEEILLLDAEKKAHLKVIFAGLTSSRIALLDGTVRAILDGKRSECNQLQALFFISDLFYQLQYVQIYIGQHPQTYLPEEAINNLSSAPNILAPAFCGRKWNINSVLDFIESQTEGSVDWSRFPAPDSQTSMYQEEGKIFGIDNLLKE